MADFVTLLILTLAVSRWVKLAYDDRITAGLRDRVLQRFGSESIVTYLVNCPWCLGIWIAAPATIITTLVEHGPPIVGEIWHAILTLFAVAYAASWIVDR